MALRLQEIPFHFGERDFLLSCNMNVLADVQEAHGGDLLSVLQSDSTLKSVTEFTAAMMNDYADAQGWQERYTAKQVGRGMKFDKKLIRDVMQLVSAAVTPDDENEKN